MSDNPIHHEVAAWMSKIAASLKTIGDLTTDHGGYYIDEVAVSFDGDSTGWRIIADEHGGFVLDIAGEGRIARTSHQDQP